MDFDDAAHTLDYIRNKYGLGRIKLKYVRYDFN